jgi:hypothetical protein
VDDADLRAALSAIRPRGREMLRRYLIADQPDRDALASRLLDEGTEHAVWLADLIDTLTMHPDERRRVVRLLGELEASDPRRLSARCLPGATCARGSSDRRNRD